jgi:hypothetical protein
MTALVGARINDVLTETEVANGGISIRPGTIVTDGSGKMYRCVKSITGQNVVNGNVVSIDGSDNATLLASDPAAPAGAFSALTLGVAVCSVTASASQLFFAQVFGQGAVRTTNLTTSNLPGHMMVAGSVPGELKCLSGTASAYVNGIVLTVTGSTATLNACFINFPRIAVA